MARSLPPSQFSPASDSLSRPQAHVRDSESSRRGYSRKGSWRSYPCCNEARPVRCFLSDPLANPLILATMALRCEALSNSLSRRRGILPRPISLASPIPTPSARRQRATLDLKPQSLRRPSTLSGTKSSLILLILSHPIYSTSFMVMRDCELIVTVWDWDMIGKDDFLGVLTIPLSDIVHGDWKAGKWSLFTRETAEKSKKKAPGEVFLQIEWLPEKVPSPCPRRPDQDFSKRRRLRSKFRSLSPTCITSSISRPRRAAAICSRTWCSFPRRAPQGVAGPRSRRPRLRRHPPGPRLKHQIKPPRTNRRLQLQSPPRRMVRSRLSRLASFCR